MPAVAPESFACQMVETVLQTTIKLIEAAIALPMQLWSVLKSQINTFLNVQINKIYAQMDEYIKKFYDTLHLDKWDNSKTKAGFCKRLWQCQALILILAEDPLVKHYFPTDNPLTIAYDVFDQYICRLSLLQLITNFVDGQLDNIRNQIQALIDSAFTVIDDLIYKYQHFLQTVLIPFPTKPYEKNRNMTVFDWLALLDAFKECSLGTCDFVETAFNSQTDIASRLGLDASGNFIGGQKVEQERVMLNSKTADDDIKQLDMILAERKAKRSTDVSLNSSTMKA